jgi:N-acetylglucosamine kinase-like BadF-type ATPase
MRLICASCAAVAMCVLAVWFFLSLTRNPTGTGGQLYGIVVISGTGMIASGFGPTGESARAGGWGPLLGDIGSGYDIGIDILRAVARSKVFNNTYGRINLNPLQDGINPPTLLTGAVLSYLGLQKEDELIPWVIF